MPLAEFDLIDRYFRRRSHKRDDIVLGIGDDAAVVRPAAGQELVVTTDLLNEGVHFPADTPPRAIGHKALAVNLSDLAAMGAQPRWFTLTLSLPQAEDSWLTAFADGLLSLAGQHGIELIGGDTVGGPLAVGVQALGEVPAGQALRRDGAGPGDRVVVSGTIGDAALALAQMRSGVADAALLERLHYPQPRVALGLALRGIASSCIDLSDGLAADLGHILEASGCAATVHAGRLPVSDGYRQAAGGDMTRALTGGDDYELCFTVPPEQEAGLAQLGRSLGLPLTVVGEIVGGSGLTVLDADGEPMTLPSAGYEHFSGQGG